LPRRLEGVALERRLHAQRGEVGAGAGLGEAEAPEVLAAEDARREALLLLLGAVGEDGRPGDADAEVADDVGGLRAAHLLDVGDLLRDARVAPAIRAGPGDADPARIGQPVLPRAQPPQPLLVGKARGLLRPQVVGNVALEPAAELASERLELGQSHGRPDSKVERRRRALDGHAGARYQAAPWPPRGVSSPQPTSSSSW